MAAEDDEALPEDVKIHDVPCENLSTMFEWKNLRGTHRTVAPSAPFGHVAPHEGRCEHVLEENPQVDREGKEDETSSVHASTGVPGSRKQGQRDKRWYVRPFSRLGANSSRCILDDVLKYYRDHETHPHV